LLNYVYTIEYLIKGNCMTDVRTKEIVDRRKVKTLQILESDLKKIKDNQLKGESLTITIHRMLSGGLN